MKLETILNAYGKAMYDIGNHKPSLFNMGWLEKRKEQAEKFKERLMCVLKQHEGECSFSFTDAYYEDELRHTCLECGVNMQIVQPGKWQCPNCE